MTVVAATADGVAGAGCTSTKLAATAMKHKTTLARIVSIPSCFRLDTLCSDPICLAARATLTADSRQPDPIDTLYTSRAPR